MLTDKEKESVRERGIKQTFEYACQDMAFKKMMKSTNIETMRLLVHCGIPDVGLLRADQLKRPGDKIVFEVTR